MGVVGHEDLASVISAPGQLDGESSHLLLQTLLLADAPPKQKHFLERLVELLRFEPIPKKHTIEQKRSTSKSTINNMKCADSCVIFKTSS